MNKKFVTPGLVNWNADAFHFTADSFDDFTLNNTRILTTRDTSTGPQGPPGEPGAPGIPTSLAAVGTSPNANGASISGNTLSLQPASQTQPGVVNTQDQTFGGVKHIPSGVWISPPNFDYSGLPAVPQSPITNFAFFAVTATVALNSAATITQIKQNFGVIANGAIQLYVQIFGNIVSVALPNLEITSTATSGPEWDLINITPGLPVASIGGNYSSAPFSAITSASGAVAVMGEVGIEALGSGGKLEFYTMDGSDWPTDFGISGIQVINYMMNNTY